MRRSISRMPEAAKPLSRSRPDGSESHRRNFRFWALFFSGLLMSASMGAASAADPLVSPETVAEHFFPEKIWFHPLEFCAWPASRNHPGAAVYRVRPHPDNPSLLAVTYALLYREDCGGVLGIDPHPGDVEAFSYTLVPDPECSLGWRLFSVKTTAHGGAPRDLGFLLADSCGPLPELFVSLRKHGTYLTVDHCNDAVDPTQRCNRGFAPDFTLLNAGDPELPAADDLSGLFPSEPGAPVEAIWSGDGRFCGGRYVDDRSECVTSPGAKLTDDTLLAPPRRDELVLVGMGDSLTHGTLDGTNNGTNTLNAYLQKIGEALSEVMPVHLTQPLFDDLEKRVDPFVTPTNLGVDGSDIFSMEGVQYYKRVGAETSYVSSELLADRWLPSRLKDTYDKVLYPYPIWARMPVSILDAAVWLIEQRMPMGGFHKAAVLLWSGNNDSSKAALGTGGLNPSFQPLPFDLIKSRLKPELRLLLAFGEAGGAVSFEPYTRSAIERNLTESDDFRTQYEAVVKRFIEETASSGVHTDIFLMTLPYYSAVGYLMDSEDLLFYLRKVRPFYRLPPTFQPVAPHGEPIVDPLRGDRISLLTFGMMYAMLESGDPVWRVNRVLQVDGIQRDGMVMSEAEQRFVMDRIDAYNEAIAEVAALYAADGVHLVDVGRLLNDAFLGNAVIEVDGRVLTRNWGRGCGFSLDGVHPGYTGHAVLANFILEHLNAVLGSEAPPVDLSAVLASDPYCDQDMDGWVRGPDYEPFGLTRLLFLFRDPDDGDPVVGPALPPDVWDQISDVLLAEILQVPTLRDEAVRSGLMEQGD